MTVLMRLFIIMMFVACHARNNDNDQPAINSQPRGLADSAASLSQQLDNPDSLIAYLKTNYEQYNAFGDSNKPEANLRLQNIMQQHEKAVKDSAAKKILMLAYMWYGFDNFSADSYNEKVVTSFERFLLLSGADTTHLYAPYAWHDLGIQYNILGDLRKSAFYYNLFNNYSSSHPDHSASGAINTSILLNELELYDSSASLVTRALAMRGALPKRKATLYAQLASTQAKMHLYKQAIANANTALDIIGKLNPLEVEDIVREKKYQALWNLGEIQSMSGDDAGAARSLDHALNIGFTHFDSSFKNREAGKMFIARGKIAEKQGLLQEALMLSEGAGNSYQC